LCPSGQSPQAAQRLPQEQELPPQQELRQVLPQVLLLLWGLEQA